MRYSIFDPAGNITALVETPVEMDRRQAAAAGVFPKDRPAAGDIDQRGQVLFFTVSFKEHQSEPIRLQGGAPFSYGLFRSFFLRAQKTESRIGADNNMRNTLHMDDGKRPLCPLKSEFRFSDRMSRRHQDRAAVLVRAGFRKGNIHGSCRTGNPQPHLKRSAQRDPGTSHII